MKFRDPEQCPNGHGRRSGNIINSRTIQGAVPYRKRRHRCNLCEARWTSYQSLMNPSEVKLTYKHVVPCPPNASHSE
jgi:transcriptional regulator NrdR family protein